MQSQDMIHGVKGIRIKPIVEQSEGVYVRDITLLANSEGMYGGERRLTLFADTKEALQIKITEERIV